MSESYGGPEDGFLTPPNQPFQSFSASPSNHRMHGLPPAVQPGQTVLIQLRTPMDGNANLERPIPMTVHTPDSCRPTSETEVSFLIDDEEVKPHSITLCNRCIVDWARDYYITLGETPFDLGLRDA